MLSMRVLAFGVVLGIASTAAAQVQPKLEIQTRQGDYYWVVETAPDGARRGGWVNVQVPLDRIDRSAFQPLPALPPLPNAPQGSPSDAARLNERLARIEQALAAEQTGGSDVTIQPVPSVQSAPLPQVARPTPQPTTLRQSRPQTRQGFWFNVGPGVGWAGCLDCVGRVAGVSGGLSLGGTLNQRVLLGVGTTGWYNSQDGLTVQGGTLDARLRIYPSLLSGFFLTVGAGFGSISATDRFGTNSEGGGGGVFGLGWDARVGRNVSLTPFYNGFAVSVASGTFYVDQIGLGVTIH